MARLVMPTLEYSLRLYADIRVNNALIEHCRWQQTRHTFVDEECEEEEQDGLRQRFGG